MNKVTIAKWDDIEDRKPAYARVGSVDLVIVRYDDNVSNVQLATYTPGVGWDTKATYPLTLTDGDQLGARAYQDGTLEAYKNGVDNVLSLIRKRDEVYFRLRWTF